MAPELTIKTDIKRDIGFFLHAVVEETKRKIRADYPEAQILDNFSAFDQVMKFISESATIVTNSFHGAYWATLMGKRVVGIPTSSKFFTFKHPIPLADVTEWRSALTKASPHFDALEECRASNVAFAGDVLEALA